MATTEAAPAETGGTRQRGAISRVLWYRSLDSYPDTGPRVFFLAVVVIATILLYYELYVAGAVAPAIIAHYHMSFKYYVDIFVVSNLVGAFASIVAGLADRWGRANLVAYGLGVTGLLILFGIPNASSELTFAIVMVAIGFVEGMLLVATPALVRDFSPQLGRASAMGFWTLGPVVGSLVVTEVASHTLTHLHAWQDQFVICGIVGLVVFVIALFGLRELSPQLRDQLMVSVRDRALVEARAKGIDVEESLKHPARQMLHLDVVGSAFAISVFLLIYYAAVGFFVIYFTTVFHGFTTARANSLANWFWAFDAVALVVVGIVSDLLKVRKPFMVLGGAGAIVTTIIFLSKATQPNTSYYTLALIISLVAISLAVAYAPWMASFTETVERRNPALVATGLAVWGWIIRITVSVSYFLIPFVVSSTTPLVTYGTSVETALVAVQKAPAVKVPYSTSPQPLLSVVEGHATLFGELGKYHPASTIPAALLGKAVGEVGLPALLEASKFAAPLGVLASHGSAVAAAAKATPHQWQHWWWVCVGGEIVFLPLILVMVGRWRPKKARKDAEDHEREVEEELAKLSSSGGSGIAPAAGT